MKQFQVIETVPTRSHLAEWCSTNRSHHRRRRRSMTLTVCLLPALILAGWGAVTAMGKFLHL